MNPETNKMEMLKAIQELCPNETPFPGQLVRPNGEPVPEHWIRYSVGDEVEVKGYWFRIGYIGESTLLLEPVGPVLVGPGNDEADEGPRVP